MQAVDGASWGCYEEPDGVHVAPMMDLVDHELTEDCVCIPTPERVSTKGGGDGWVFTHHSLDGREADE